MKKLIIVLCLMIVSVMGCQTKENKEVVEEKTKTEASKDTEVITEKEIAINTSGEEKVKQTPQEQKTEGKQVSSEPTEKKEQETKQEKSNQQPVTTPSDSQKESEDMDLISGIKAEELVTNYLLDTGRKIQQHERIVYDHTEGYNLIVHHYEQLEDHTATINWYEVDGVTGAIVPKF